MYAYSMSFKLKCFLDDALPYRNHVMSTNFSVYSVEHSFQKHIRVSKHYKKK